MGGPEGVSRGCLIKIVYLKLRQVWFFSSILVFKPSPWIDMALEALSLITRVYKWVPATHCWGSSVMDWYPIQGGVANDFLLKCAIEAGFVSFSRVDYLAGLECDFTYLKLPSYLLTQ